MKGVATEGLWALFDAGEAIRDNANGYDMPTELVRPAVAYEEHQRSLAAL